MSKVEITTRGIRKALKGYSIEQAIAEYIWNGFDAQATEVDLRYKANEIGTISELTVVDNGYGIPKGMLGRKFKPFYVSEKDDMVSTRNSSATHGKTGVGRLTFHRFAMEANWETTYAREDVRYGYSIFIRANQLETYQETAENPASRPTGTTVAFMGIHEITAYELAGDITEYLMREFGWFLELNAAKGIQLRINGEPLHYSSLIGDTEHTTYEDSGSTFEIRYVRWEVSINGEYSRYYYVNSSDIERYKETTTLNNKGDGFYHSVYVKSAFFDEYEFRNGRDNSVPASMELPTINDHRRHETMKRVREYVDKFLRGKRKPFLFKYTDRFIDELEHSRAFPRFSQDEWDILRKNQLVKVIRELYQVEPRIWVGLNNEQKKTFVHLLNLIMDSGERDRLFNVLSEIVNLDTNQRADLAEVLRTTRLSNIIQTIQMIADRKKSVDQLKKLVFCSEYGANERDHVQKYVESCYWLFGEEYHLVGAAELKFDKALREYLYLLGSDDKAEKITHPDRLKELDIFLVRWLKQLDVVQNVIVELKHPDLTLGEKELSQVKKYMQVILSADQFNASNMTWKFYLVGNRINSFIEGEIENASSRGERNLVHAVRNHKIYVRTWSEIFTDFDLRHDFLLERLKFEQIQLTSTETTAAEIIEHLPQPQPA